MLLILLIICRHPKIQAETVFTFLNPKFLANSCQMKAADLKHSLFRGFISSLILSQFRFVIENQLVKLLKFVGCMPSHLGMRFSKGAELLKVRFR